jgi:acyl-CoA thioesterase
MDIRMPAPKVKEAETRKKVIVYRKELLRVSETFITAQVQSYQRKSRIFMIISCRMRKA